MSHNPKFIPLAQAYRPGEEHSERFIEALEEMLGQPTLYFVRYLEEVPCQSPALDREHGKGWSVTIPSELIAEIHSANPDAGNALTFALLVDGSASIAWEDIGHDLSLAENVRDAVRTLLEYDLVSQADEQTLRLIQFKAAFDAPLIEEVLGRLGPGSGAIQGLRALPTTAPRSYIARIRLRLSILTLAQTAYDELRANSDSYGAKVVRSMLARLALASGLEALGGFRSLEAA